MRELLRESDDEKDSVVGNEEPQLRFLAPHRTLLQDLHDSDWEEIDEYLELKDPLEHPQVRADEKQLFAEKILERWGKLGLLIASRAKKINFDRRL